MDNNLKLPCEVGEVSDGYHTFNELYDHRITLFIALSRLEEERHSVYNSDHYPEIHTVWRSKLHSDGSSYDGWFILGINKEQGKQITYHLPIERWNETDFAETLEKAPEWDGHTPQDVLARIKNL